MSDGSLPTRLRVSTWVVSERRDRVYDGSTRDANPLDERTAITVPSLSVDVRLTPALGVQVSAAIPLIARTAVVPRSTGTTDFRETVRGLGDTVVGAWYRRGSPGRWMWTVNGGVSIPTGATRTPRFRTELEEGSLVPLSRLQRGSGTWDPVIGGAVERPISGGRWVSSAAVRWPLAENRHGLRTGAAWEVGSGYAHTVGSHRIMAFARVDWLHREQDVYEGTRVLVGGGEWVYVNGGAGVMVGKGVNLQADVRLPAYRRLANRQLDSAAIFGFGVSRSF
jgi:hypothetical protein